MARAEILYTVEKVVGGNSQPVNGASVQVNLRSGGAATIYAAETGGTTLSNPVLTDSNGEINGWLDENSYNLVISGTGISTHTVPYEAARGDAMNAIDGSTRLIDGSVTTAKLRDGAVTGPKIQDLSITQAKLQSGSGLTPSGTIFAFGGTAPGGYLLCDGASYATATYPALFAVIGYAFGGSGSNFNVPDFRGRAPVGVGTNTAVNAIGKNDGLAVASRSPLHSHPISNDGGHSHTVNSHAHHVPSHNHTIVDHTHSVIGDTGQAGQALNQIGGAPSYGSIWGYASDPNSGSGGTSATISSTRGTNVNFQLMSHTHPMFLVSSPAGAGTTGNWQGDTDLQAPGTSAVAAHNHGGQTNTVASPPFLVVQFIIKT